MNVLGAGSTLTFQGTQTFDGATINFGSNTKSVALSVSDPTGAGAVLTLGANANVQQRGAMAEIDIDRGLGDALVNKGLIAANSPNGRMAILGGTFTNAGRVVVAAADTLALEADQISNLTGSVLAGGYWEVNANSTLNLGIDNPILSLNAVVVLNGAGSQILYYNSTQFQTMSLEQTLRSVASGAVLVLQNGRTFNDPGALAVNGQVSLSAGILAAQSITVGGLLVGSGTITASTISDSGHVFAQGGQLVLNAPLLAGSLAGDALIAAGATLVANQAVAVPVRFQASTGTLAVAQGNALTGTIVGFTGSDAIDLLTVSPSAIALSFAPGVGQATLTVKSGAITAATLHFSGNYVAANFRFTADGHGGTLILDPPVPLASTANWTVTSGDLARPPSGAVTGDSAHTGTLAAGIGVAMPSLPPPSLLVAHA